MIEFQDHLRTLRLLQDHVEGQGENEGKVEELTVFLRIRSSKTACRSACGFSIIYRSMVQEFCTGYCTWSHFCGRVVTGFSKCIY